MKYISAAEFADKHNIAERTARHYCACGKIDGAFLTGKTWNIPQDAPLPPRARKHGKEMPLLTILREQMTNGIKGGIYHKIQISLTYNSNHIEGSQLTEEQTRHIFETKSIIADTAPARIDDIIETNNHFRCVDYIIQHALTPLSESMICELHRILKSNTSNSTLSWFAVGAYKRIENEVGGMDTTPPHLVHQELQKLIHRYKRIKKKTLDDILNFHHALSAFTPSKMATAVSAVSSCSKNASRTTSCPLSSQIPSKPSTTAASPTGHTSPATSATPASPPRIPSNSG